MVAVAVVGLEHRSGELLQAFHSSVMAALPCCDGTYAAVELAPVACDVGVDIVSAQIA